MVDSARNTFEALTGRKALVYRDNRKRQTKGASMQNLEEKGKGRKGQGEIEEAQRLTRKPLRILSQANIAAYKGAS